MTGRKLLDSFKAWPSSEASTLTVSVFDLLLHMVMLDLPHCGPLTSLDALFNDKRRFLRLFLRKTRALVRTLSSIGCAKAMAGFPDSP